MKKKHILQVKNCKVMCVLCLFSVELCILFSQFSALQMWLRELKVLLVLYGIIITFYELLIPEVQFCEFFWKKVEKVSSKVVPWPVWYDWTLLNWKIFTGFTRE